VNWKIVSKLRDTKITTCFTTLTTWHSTRVKKNGAGTHGQATQTTPRPENRQSHDMPRRLSSEKEMASNVHSGRQAGQKGLCMILVGFIIPIIIVIFFIIIVIAASFFHTDWLKA